MTETLIEHDVVTKVGAAIEQMYRTFDIPDVIDEDVVIDASVPLWQFQIRGARTLQRVLREEYDGGATTFSWDAEATPSGLVMECEYTARDHRGQELYCRQMWRVLLRDGRVVSAHVYCTGDWDVETRERHGREETIITA